MTLVKDRVSSCDHLLPRLPDCFYEIARTKIQSLIENDCPQIAEAISTELEYMSSIFDWDESYTIDVTWTGSRTPFIRKFIECENKAEWEDEIKMLEYCAAKGLKYDPPEREYILRYLRSFQEEHEDYIIEDDADFSDLELDHISWNMESRVIVHSLRMKGLDHYIEEDWTHHIAHYC